MTGTNTPISLDKRVAAVRSIGAGIRKSDTLSAEIVAAMPEGFDSSARGAVTAFVSEYVNGSNPAPAQRTGGKGGPRTDYGIGFDALVSAVKRLISSADTKVALRATLSGEGGGSVTIPTDHALYAALVALITEGNES